MADPMHPGAAAGGRGITRRSFVRAGALGALALGNAEQLWAQVSGAPVPASATPPARAATSSEFESSTIADLSAAMAAGKLTSRALCEAYVNRIRAMDGDLHAVLETNPEALDIATGSMANAKPASCAVRCTASRCS
jgi:amidase